MPRTLTMLLNYMKSSKTHKIYNKLGSVQTHSQLKINMSEKCYNEHKLQVAKIAIKSC